MVDSRKGKQKMKKNENVQAEIDRLTERSRKLSRRQFAKTAAFAIPALSAFSVSKQALGMTGSGSGGGGMMMMTGGMMKKMMW